MCSLPHLTSFAWLHAIFPQLLSSVAAKKIVKSYNKIVKTLVAFEFVWLDAWSAQVDRAKAGLAATLLVRHPTNGRLFVNFDPGE